MQDTLRKEVVYIGTITKRKSVTALTPSTVATELAVKTDLIPDGKEEKYIQPEDIAEYIVAQLKLNPRVYVKTASLLGTNPF